MITPNGKKWIISSIDEGSIATYDKPIAPSKGNVYRDVNINNLPYEYADDYNTVSFPENIAYLRDIYSIRDFDAQTLVINPIKCDGSNHIIKKYNELTITLKAIDAVSNNTRANKAIVNDYDKIYSNLFLNYNFEMQERYIPLEEDGDMLIICYDDFMDAMQPFVNWK